MRILTIAAAALAVGAVAFGILTPAETGQAAAQTSFKITEGVSNSYHSKFGNWESICEKPQPSTGINAATGSSTLNDNCYLRYVDIYVTREKTGSGYDLGIVAAFVVPDKRGVRVEFGFEPGMSFDPRGFHLSREGLAVWRLDKDQCLASGVCTFTGPAAEALVRSFSDQTGDTLEMRLEFTDQNGQQQSRQWQMLPFSAAFDDFVANQQRYAM
jgi:hypothetical protein